jgi:hypothetical protein
MTTEHELDEILRRAMHAAVESVEPAGDGLQHIRRELTKPRLRLQIGLLLTESGDLVRLVGIRLEPAATRTWDMFRRAWVSVMAAIRQPSGSAEDQADGRPRRGAAHRSQPPGRLASLLSPAIAWLRPALAVAGAVVIVVAGVFTLFTLRQTVSPMSLLTGGGQSPAVGASAGPGGGHSGVPGITTTSPGLVPSSRSKGTKHHASPSPTCTPGTSTRPPGASPTPTVTPSPSITPSVTPSPTDTGSPTPTVSDTSAPVNSAPPAGLGAGGGPVQLTSGCFSAKKSRAGSPSSSPAP